ncbi:hypothetical protein [Sphingosinithalassobacter sp. CS137]|uniref:hypothetical protein n=1 Tax=Sphingosinithalassobacter sp. CS137 TaxID=2762748 RepID=UPI00165D65BC|nr:hypothetical protein [Sphingosinithalassobacter sp. CS137]
MDRKTHAEAAELHENLDYIGLRAQATSVGLVQLCAELVAAGVLDDAAMERVKQAIRADILVSRRVHDRAGFAELLKERLDAIFPQPGNPCAHGRIGTAGEMESALAPRA